MIVQTAPEGEPRLVITMEQHTAFAGALARAFGNETFEPVRPEAEMLYVVDHHDAGWRPYDAQPEADPSTGLPYHLGESPRAVTIATGTGSAEFNEAHHPYCGLLSSMHIWGLYNGRYGYSDKVLINAVPEEWRPAFDEMLDAQLVRQERLKDTLRADPKTAPWVEEAHLFQNYKQLQLFDTLALYFHCAHPGARGKATFLHVPKSATADVDVTIEPLGEKRYRFAPFPWREDGIELAFSGRCLVPAPGRQAAAMQNLLAETPVCEEKVIFVA